MTLMEIDEVLVPKALWDNRAQPGAKADLRAYVDNLQLYLHNLVMDTNEPLQRVTLRELEGEDIVDSVVVRSVKNR